jgi:hypothetical protein
MQQVAGGVAGLAALPQQRSQMEQEGTLRNLSAMRGALAARESSYEQMPAAGTTAGKHALETGVLKPGEDESTPTGQLPTLASTKATALANKEKERHDLPMDEMGAAEARKQLGLQPGTPITQRQFEELKAARDIYNQRQQLLLGWANLKETQKARHQADIHIALEAGQPALARGQFGEKVHTTKGEAAGLVGPGTSDGSSTAALGSVPGTAASIPGSTQGTAPNLTPQQAAVARAEEVLLHDPEVMDEKERERFKAAKDALIRLPDLLPDVISHPNAFGPAQRMSEYVGGGGLAGIGYAVGGAVGAVAGAMGAPGIKNAIDALQNRLRDPADLHARTQVDHFLQDLVTSLAGKTQTVMEKQLIESWAPSPTDSVQAIVTKVSSALEWAQKETDKFYGGAGAKLPRPGRAQLPPTPSYKGELYTPKSMPKEASVQPEFASGVSRLRQLAPNFEHPAFAPWRGLLQKALAKGRTITTRPCSSWASSIRTLPRPSRT